MTNTSFAQQTENSLPSCLLVLRKRVAFTLAEVLITLGIIGIVAAITIPSLISNYRKLQTVVTLKKAYSEIMQAIKLSEAEYGPKVDGLGTRTDWLAVNADFLENYLGKSIKFVKTCIPSSEACWKMPEQDLTSDKVFGTRYSSRFVSAITADGYSIYFWLGGANGDGHAHIFIDVDGPNKGKQTLGKDIFRAFYSFKINGMGSIDMSRDDLIRECREKDQCLKLIMHDGWQIAPDYPHKL